MPVVGFLYPTAPDTIPDRVRMLGLTVLDKLLVAADEVIE